MHSLNEISFISLILSTYFLSCFRLLCLNNNLYNVFVSDLVLSNKLVVYDLENQVIGWTDYNCKDPHPLM
jgi:hypothetical protein